MIPTLKLTLNPIFVLIIITHAQVFEPIKKHGGQGYLAAPYSAVAPQYQPFSATWRPEVSGNYSHSLRSVIIRYDIGLLVYWFICTIKQDILQITVLYHVESSVDEPPWVTAAAGSLANLELILLRKMIK